PQRQTSRGKVSRIDRSYFHRPNRFQRTRRWLTLACLGLGIAWAAWGAFDAPLHHAPGPVAAVHAKWENDCNACHVPFSPIKDDTWLSTASTRQAMDGKCEACHRGPAHHPLQVTAEVGSCASCHVDHRGRGADISRVADQTCTACHANIAAHRLVDAAVPPAAVTTPITRFDDEHHPAFAGLASDPGRLKFSHGRHMRAGLSFGPTPTEPGAARALTYGMLTAADRRRYQPATAGEHDFVQLSCASCHEFGSSLPPDAVRTLPAALAGSPPGAYALPVDFERHCAACHQLPFEGLVGQPAATADLVMTKPDAVLPHGLDAAGIARFLETRYLQEALAQDPSPLDEPLVRRPLPAARPAEAAPAKVRSVVEGHVARALAFTRGTCEKCHETRDASVPEAAHLLTAGSEDRGRLPWFAIEPTRVPTIWLTKARFDHGPHRAYDCRECHAAAAPDDSGAGSQVATLPVGSPLDNGLVMIAGRESCTACHAPPGHDAFSGKPIGGARFDCVECHGYHGLGPHQAISAVSSAGSTAGSPPGALTHARPD
ncbi:MAG: hypothetical protein ACKO6B_06760, partial [Planctomycetia bacterium]